MTNPEEDFTLADLELLTADDDFLAACVAPIVFKGLDRENWHVAAALLLTRELRRIAVAVEDLK